MKTIDEYTIYCTEEQTRKALKLGASLKYTYGDCGIRHYINPTTEQMIGWLEEQGFEFEGNNHYTAVDYKDKGCIGMRGGPRKDTILIVIDAALDYLIYKMEG